MDPYLDDTFVTDRLIEEWRTHGRLVIAYDFDNTVYDFHKKGFTYDNVINLLRECQEQGAYLIVFSASEEDRYAYIANYLNEHDIPFDIINENPPFLPFKGRKVYYNILLDDRAGLSSAYECLSAALQVIKSD